MSSAALRVPAAYECAPSMAEVCARYADLIIRQLEAIEADDHAAFERLSDERDRVAEEIGALQTVPGPDPDADRVAEQLERCVEADRMLLDRLARLRAEAAAGLQRLGQRRSGALAYGAPRRSAHGSVDLSL